MGRFKMSGRIGKVMVGRIFVALLILGCTGNEGTYYQGTGSTAGKVLKLNEANFDAVVAEGIVLVDFWAPWCGPCRIQGPIIESLAKKVGDDVKIAKVNVDNARNIASKFGIRSIPTLIIFKDGKAVQQFVGLSQEKELLAAIESVR
jgi:thioredoxin 1